MSLGFAQTPSTRHGTSASRTTAGEALCICQPVRYEVLRGLLWVGATVKLTVLQDNVLPLFQTVTLTDEDWELAARLWAFSVNAGKQLADVDLLLAAAAQRLDAIIASSDTDFDALPVQREDWRTTVLGES
ncbi:MAG: PIN domain-containing protein [Chloroflexota bacterium]